MPSVTISQDSNVEMTDFPLLAEQVLEGSPQAKIWIHAQSADKLFTQGVWDCTAGQFSWDYQWDEFVMILEGEATITVDNGEPFTLRAGDFCHFPNGLKTIWQVDDYVKKTFTLRTPEPLEL